MVYYKGLSKLSFAGWNKHVYCQVWPVIPLLKKYHLKHELLQWDPEVANYKKGLHNNINSYLNCHKHESMTRFSLLNLRGRS